MTPVAASRACVAGPTPHISPTGRSCRNAQLGRRIDHDQAIRLGDLRGDLGQVLGARDADRDRQPELGAHPRADAAAISAGEPNRCSVPGDVGERLVDGDALDQRGEVAEHRDRRVAEPLVLVEMAADEDQLRAELARPPPRHAAAHAERPRLVGGREHHAAADRDRLAAQRRVEQLLDRRIEGVEVGMEDRRGPGHVHLDRRTRT